VVLETAPAVKLKEENTLGINLLLKSRFKIDVYLIHIYIYIYIYLYLLGNRVVNTDVAIDNLRPFQSGRPVRWRSVQTCNDLDHGWSAQIAKFEEKVIVSAQMTNKRPVAP